MTEDNNNIAFYSPSEGEHSTVGGVSLDNFLESLKNDKVEQSVIRSTLTINFFPSTYQFSNYDDKKKCKKRFSTEREVYSHLQTAYTSLANHIEKHPFPYKNIEIVGSFLPEAYSSFYELIEMISLNNQCSTECITIVELGNNPGADKYLGKCSNILICNFKKNKKCPMLIFKNKNSVPEGYMIYRDYEQKDKPSEENIKKYRELEALCIENIDKCLRVKWEDINVINSENPILKNIQSRMREIKYLESSNFLKKQRAHYNLSSGLVYEQQEQQEQQEQIVSEEQQQMFVNEQLQNEKNQQSEKIELLDKKLELLTPLDFNKKIISDCGEQYENIRFALFSEANFSEGIKRISLQAYNVIARCPSNFLEGVNLNNLPIGFILVSDKPNLTRRANYYLCKSNTYALSRSEGEWSLEFFNESSEYQTYKVGDESYFKELLVFLNEKIPEQNFNKKLLSDEEVTGLFNRLNDTDKKHLDAIVNNLFGAFTVLHYDLDLYYNEQIKNNKITTPLTPIVFPSNKKDKKEWWPIEYYLFNGTNKLDNKKNVIHNSLGNNILQQYLQVIINKESESYVELISLLYRVRFKKGSGALKVFVTALKILADVNLLDSFFKVFLSNNDIDWADCLSPDKIVCISHIAGLNVHEKRWWQSLTEQHKEAGGYIELCTLFNAFEYFCKQITEMKLTLPEDCSLSRVQNIPVVLDRLLLILQKSSNKQWQLDHLNGVDITSHGAFYAINNEAYQFVTSEMLFSIHSLKIFKFDEPIDDLQPQDDKFSLNYYTSSNKMQVCFGNDIHPIKYQEIDNSDELKCIGELIKNNSSDDVFPEDLPLMIRKRQLTMKNKYVLPASQGDDFDTISNDQVLDFIPFDKAYDYYTKFRTAKCYLFSQELFVKTLLDSNNAISFNRAQKLFYRYLGQQKWIAYDDYDSYRESLLEIKNQAKKWQSRLLLILALGTSGNKNVNKKFRENFTQLINILAEWNMNERETLFLFIIESLKIDNVSLESIINNSIFKNRKQFSLTSTETEIIKWFSENNFQRKALLEIFWLRTCLEKRLDAEHYFYFIKKAHECFNSNDTILRLCQFAGLISNMEEEKIDVLFKHLKKALALYKEDKFDELLTALLMIEDTKDFSLSNDALLSMIPVDKIMLGFALYQRFTDICPTLTFKQLMEKQESSFQSLLFTLDEFKYSKEINSVLSEKINDKEFIKKLLELYHTEWLMKKSTYQDENILLTRMFLISEDNDENLNPSNIYYKIIENNKKLEKITNALSSLQNDDRAITIKKLSQFYKNNKPENILNNICLLLDNAISFSKFYEILSSLNKIGTKKLNNFLSDLSDKNLFSFQKEQLLLNYSEYHNRINDKLWPCLINLKKINIVPPTIYNKLLALIVTGKVNQCELFISNLIKIANTHLAHQYFLKLITWLCDQDIDDAIKLINNSNENIIQVLVLLLPVDIKKLLSLIKIFNEFDNNVINKIIKIIATIKSNEDIDIDNFFTLLEKLKDLDQEKINQLADLYNYQPSPIFKKILGEFENNDPFSEKFFTEFEINPYSVENRSDMFKVNNEVVKQIISDISDLYEEKKLSDTIKNKLLDAFITVNEWGYCKDIPIPKGLDIKTSPAKDLSRKNIQSLLLSYKEYLCNDEIQKSKASMEEALLICIALFCEGLYRTDKVLRYPVQLVGILAMSLGLTNNNYQLLRVCTGEGKTEISRLFSAIKYIQGYTVDICVSNEHELTTEEYRSAQNFYRYCNINSALITPDSDIHEYSLDQIHYATVGNITNFRSKCEFFSSQIQENNKKVVNPDPKKRFLLLNEADDIFYDDFTLYNYATDIKFNGVSNNPYEWIYPLINDFVDSSEYQLLLKNPDATYEDEFQLACAFILNRIKDNNEKLNLFLLWLGDGSPQQVSDFAEEKMIPWIHSAEQMKKLEEGSHYIVNFSHTKKVFGKLAQVSEVVLLNEAQRPTTSKYSRGGHQLLTATVKLKYNNVKYPFVFDQELDAVVTKTNENFLNYYNNGSVLFLTATPGSKNEIQEVKEKYNLWLLDLPPNKKSRLVKNDIYVNTINDDKNNYLSVLYELLDKEMYYSPILIDCCDAKQAENIYSILLGKRKYTLQLHTGEKTIYNEQTFLTFDEGREHSAIINAGKKGVITVSNVFRRGTNIKLEKSNNVGLVSIIIRKKGERSDQQAIGRVARNGAPGKSYRLIFDTDDTNINKNEIIKKQKRIKQSYIGNIELEFLYSYFKISCSIKKYDDKKIFNKKWVKYKKYLNDTWDNIYRADESKLIDYVKQTVDVACDEWNKLLDTVDLGIGKKNFLLDKNNIIKTVLNRFKINQHIKEYRKKYLSIIDKVHKLNHVYYEKTWMIFEMQANQNWSTLIKSYNDFDTCCNKLSEASQSDWNNLWEFHDQRQNEYNFLLNKIETSLTDEKKLAETIIGEERLIAYLDLFIKKADYKVYSQIRKEILQFIVNAPIPCWRDNVFSSYTKNINFPCATYKECQLIVELRSFKSSNNGDFTTKVEKFLELYENIFEEDNPRYFLDSLLNNLSNGSIRDKIKHLARSIFPVNSLNNFIQKLKNSSNHKNKKHFYDLLAHFKFIRPTLKSLYLSYLKKRAAIKVLIVCLIALLFSTIGFVLPFLIKGSVPVSYLWLAAVITNKALAFSALQVGLITVPLLVVFTTLLLTSLTILVCLIQLYLSNRAIKNDCSSTSYMRNIIGDDALYLKLLDEYDSGYYGSYKSIIENEIVNIMDNQQSEEIAKQIQNATY